MKKRKIDHRGDRGRECARSSLGQVINIAISQEDSHQFIAFSSARLRGECESPIKCLGNIKQTLGWINFSEEFYERRVTKRKERKDSL